ncbi:hypothetical protein ACLESD_11870 [Pyxidicoccus sp. 3LFB2]
MSTKKNSANSPETLSLREVYRNGWMTVREDTLRRQDGAEGIYGVVCKVDFSLITQRTFRRG